MQQLLQQLLQQVGLRSDELQGQVAVVTGAGRGIGRAAALALALAGARVVLAELDQAEGQETERLIQEAGGQAQFMRADIAAEADVTRLAAAVGPATILINNAILCPVAPVSDMDVALWDRVMAVNLRGAFLMVKAFLPAMRQLGRGVIVNMVSADAMPGLSAYIASKQGLTGFSQSLAVEVGLEGIQVVAFGPGMVETPGLRAAGQELAPLLGMPVAHAGLATAYLVARLAAEYHGEAVTGYAVLERAGLLASPVAAGAMTPGGVRPVPPAAGMAPLDSRAELQRLCGRLEAILAETAADFDKLPIFIRPLARSGFRGKAGQSLQDWQGTAADLRVRLERGEPVDGPRLQGLLDGLLRYVQVVPAETARFTRDQALLRTVSERMAAYEADLRALKALL